VQRFITGTYSIPATAHGSSSGLWRDTYGFKKIIVAATSTGKLFGIETAKGKTIWNVKLGTGGIDLDMKVGLVFFFYQFSLVLTL
jgi:outer membrane protein assembly factor BamB